MIPEEIGSKGNITVIKYGDIFLKITVGDLEENVNTDRLTKIDINNIVGEIVTTPVIVNRWGNVLAEVKKQYEIEKMNFEIFCANAKADIRLEATKDAKKITIDEVESSLIRSDDYKQKKTKLIDCEKAVELVNNLFWSLKDKSEKLNKLSLTIVREDIQNMETTVINNVQILVKKAGAAKKKKAVEEED